MELHSFESEDASHSSEISDEYQGEQLLKNASSTPALAAAIDAIEQIGQQNAEGAKAIPLQASVLTTDCAKLCKQLGAISKNIGAPVPDAAAVNDLANTQVRALNVMRRQFHRLQESAASVPAGNQHEVRKLCKTLGKLTETMDTLSELYVVVGNFTNQHQDLKHASEGMKTQCAKLQTHHLDYSSHHLAVAVDAVTAEVSNLDHLHQLKNPIKQDLNQLSKILPNYTSTLHQSLAVDLKETWAQLALANKAAVKGDLEVFSKVVEGHHHWYSLVIEHQAYVSTLLQSQKILIETISTLKKSDDPTGKSLAIHYEQLLKQVEIALKETEPIAEWYKEAHRTIETTLLNTMRNVLSDPQILFNILDPLRTLTDKMSHESIVTPTEQLEWCQSDLQIRYLAHTLKALPVDETRADHVLLEELSRNATAINTALALTEKDKRLLDTALRVAYCNSLAPATAGMKRSVEQTTKVTFEVLAEQGEDALLALSDQQFALEDLILDYSPKPLTEILVHVQRLLGFYQGCQSSERTRQHAAKFSELIVSELRYINWQIEDFSDDLLASLQAALAEADALDDGDREDRIQSSAEYLQNVCDSESEKIEEALTFADPQMCREATTLLKQIRRLGTALQELISDESSDDLKPEFWVSLMKEPAYTEKPISKKMKSLVRQKEKRDIENAGYSETKKQFVSFALLGLLGGSWVAEAIKLPEKGEALREKAEAASKHLRESVSPKIERDASFIGMMLSDKLSVLRTCSDETFDKLTKRNPDARDTLHEFRYSSGKLTSHQIQQTMEAYIMRQAVQSETPMTIGEWLDAFYQPEVALEAEKPVPEGWKGDLHSILRKVQSHGIIIETAPSIGTLEGLSALLGQAILQNDPTMVSHFVDLGAPLRNPLVAFASTPLELALEQPRPNIMIVKTLMEHGITYPRWAGAITTLGRLAEVDLDLLEMACRRGLDLTKPPRNSDWTGVELLIASGGPLVSEWLLRNPALVGFADPLTGHSAIEIAIHHHNIDYIDKYLELGNDLPSRDDRSSVLHLACEVPGSSNEQVIQLLVNHGIPIDAPAPLTGQTALYQSLSAGNKEAAQVLLNMGADSKILSISGQSMLHALAEAPIADFIMLDTLLNMGLDINAVDNNGDTPFMSALRHSNHEMALFLQECGADTAITNKSGESPLSILLANWPRKPTNECSELYDSLSSHLNLTKCWLNVISHANDYAYIHLQHHLADDIALANLDFRDDQGNTLVHLLAAKGDTKLVDTLLRKIDLKILNAFGETALHIAAKNSNLPVVRLLCDADSMLLTVKNNSGRTALDIAMSHNNFLVAQYLSDRLKAEPPETWTEQIGRWTDTKVELAYANTGGIGDTLIADLGLGRGSDTVERLRFLKYFTHSWELQGETRMGSLKISLEGSIADVHLPFMEEALNHFHAAYPDLMTMHQKSLVSDLLNHSTDQHYWHGGGSLVGAGRNMKVLSSIRDQGTALIHTGWHGHAIEIVIHDGYLMLCNRGQGSDVPIDAYKIDVTKFNAQILEGFSSAEMNDFQREFPKMIAKLGGHKDVTCETLERLNPLRESQAVGNCSYESTETAIFGTLALDALLNSGGTPFLDQAAMMTTFETHQALSNHMRLNALEEYLNLYKEHLHQEDFPIGHQMLLGLFQKPLEELQTRSSKDVNSSTINELMNEMYHCRYVMDRTNGVAQDCLRNMAILPPRWRERMEERYGRLKAVYHGLYPNAVKIRLNKLEIRLV